MYQRILVALDGSDTSNNALDAAIRLGQDCRAKLIAVCVADNTPVLYDAGYYDPTVLRQGLLEEGQRVLEAAAQKISAAGLEVETRQMEVELLGDDIAHEIDKAAEAAQADVVVLGTHGRRGFKRVMLGSVAERYVRISSRPVLLIPAHRHA
jgi:nucleotide-binding universal stress UspA family protein